MAAFNVVDAGTGVGAGVGVELTRTEGKVVTKGARLVFGCLGMGVGLVGWFCKVGLKVVEYCRKGSA